MSAERDELKQRIRAHAYDCAVAMLGPPVKHAGVNDSWRNPWRGDSNPSLDIHRETGLWTDRATGEKGDVFHLAAKIHNLDVKSDFPAVVNACAAHLGFRPGELPARAAAAPKPPPAPRPAIRVDPGNPCPRKGQPDHVYHYSPTFRIVRWNATEQDPKDIRPLHSTAEGWFLGDPPAPLPLYGLHRLETAAAILVSEGEKAADAAQRLLDTAAPGGWASLTWAHGTGSIAKADWSPLAGRTVHLLPDADAAGIKAMAAIATILDGLGCTVMTCPHVGPPDSKRDAADWPAGDADGFLAHVLDEPAPAVRVLDIAPPELPTRSLEHHAPITEAGMAARIARKHAGRVHYCPEWDSWLNWDERRWKRAPGDAPCIELAKDEVSQSFDKAKKLEKSDKSSDVETAEAIIKALARLTKSSGLSGVARLARSEPALAAESSMFDRDAMALNVTNGTLDLGTGELRPHNPADHITKISPVAYDPAAECPTWTRFLATAMDGDADLVDYLQRLSGYCLTGLVDEHVLPVLYGHGANGKSTFLQALLHVCGDYAAPGDSNLLTSLRDRDANGPSPAVAGLAGKRMVAFEELADGAAFNEALVKSLTGGTAITARFLHASSFTFMPSHKMLLATNHKPRIKGTDEGIWRRLPMIPFTVTIPADKRDPMLGAKLRREAPGILAWAVRGWMDVQANGGGLRPPQAVLVTTNEFRAESDSLGRFIEEACVKGNNMKARAGFFHDQYSAWAKRAGERALNVRATAEYMDRMGYDAHKTEHGKFYMGIGVAANDDGQND